MTASGDGKPDDLRYGVIGTGMMGIEHIQNIAAIDGARVVAIADPHAASRDAATATIDDPDLQVFTDHRALLESGDCDAVVVATPNMTHADILIDVLATGTHVLVEKPLATTVAECQAILAAAEDYDGVAWVGLEYRYMPPIARIVREVSEGAAGTVRMVAIREHRFPFLPKIDAWNRFNRNSGGTLVEKCCHFFDLMTLFAGDIPVRVMASGGQDVNHLDELYEGEIPDIIDNAYVIVEYANGVRGMLDLCMFAEGGANEQEVCVTGDVGKVEAFVPDGTVRLGKRADPGFRVERITDDRILYNGLHHGSSYLEHLDFLAAIRNGTPPLVSLQDGLNAVAMGVAAHRSIDEGRPVRLDEVLEVSAPA
jgi:myo-inositol 2-dehydrogenase / D-chiro-inositol 1-dehydrogenase